MVRPEDPATKHKNKIREIRKNYPTVFDFYYKHEKKSLDILEKLIDFKNEIQRNDRMPWTDIYKFYQGKKMAELIFLKSVNALFKETNDPDIFLRFINFDGVVNLVYKFSATKQDIAEYIKNEYIADEIMDEDEETLMKRLNELSEEYWLKQVEDIDRQRFLLENARFSEQTGYWLDVIVNENIQGLDSLENIKDVLKELDEAAASLEALAPYDYTELEELIKEKFGTRRELARKMDVSEPVISKRLNHLCYFQMPEIEEISQLLGADLSDIGRLFFRRKNWKSLLNL